MFLSAEGFAFKACYNPKLIVPLLLLFPSVLTAGEFFIDTFEDGSAVDGLPAVWLPGAAPGGEREVLSGSFVNTPPLEGPMSTWVRDQRYEDITIRTQIRMSNPFAFVGVFSRSVGPDSYLASIDPAGTIGIWLWQNQNATLLGDFETGLDITATDVSLKFDNFGTELSLSAWDSTDSEPRVPQLTVLDDSFPMGSIGLWSNSGGNATSASYRFFQVVPEPSTAGLCALALGGVLTSRILERRRDACTGTPTLR